MGAGVVAAAVDGVPLDVGVPAGVGTLAVVRVVGSVVGVLVGELVVTRGVGSLFTL